MLDSAPNISHVESEIGDIKQQLRTMDSKHDAMTSSLSDIRTMLARQEGADLPAKLSTIENKFESEIKLINTKISGIKEEQDKRALLPEQVQQAVKDIRSLFKFQYMLTGVLVVVQVVSAVAGKYVVERIFSQ